MSDDYQTIEQIDAALDRAWGRLWLYRVNNDESSMNAQEKVVNRLLDERLVLMKEKEAAA